MPIESLEGARALVTGASRGIGRAIAMALAAEGVALGLSGRDQEALDECSEEILKISGLSPTLIVADLSDTESATRIVDEAAAKLGGIDFLINNAGIGLNRSIEETEVEDWDRLMAINARAPFLLCKASLPFLRRSPRASIINMASVMGRKGYAHQGAYAASKHALVGFTKVLARELQQENIRVHVLTPGGVYTDMIRQVRPDIEPDDLMSPTEIAEMVIFLLSQRGNAIIDEINPRRIASTPFD